MNKEEKTEETKEGSYEVGELIIRRLARIFCEEAIMHMIETHSPDEVLHFLGWWAGQMIEDIKPSE